MKLYPIRAEATLLDEGIHVLLTGGCRGHVGSVSVACPGEDARTLTFPEHRERVVSERWASALSERFKCPAAVVCGIHYDGLDRDGLGRVLQTLDRMLEEILTGLSI